MKKSLVIVLFLLSLTPTMAQKYLTSAGVRVGNGQYGFSVRQRVFQTLTLEGIGTAGTRDMTGTLLLEKHFPLLGRGFNLYTGAGGHIGTLKEHGVFMGFDAILGAELKLPVVPLTVSIDLKPAYHFEHEEWFDLSSAVSVHYVIAKDTKKQRKRTRKRRQRRKDRQEKREERRENGDGWFKNQHP